MFGVVFAAAAVLAAALLIWASTAASERGRPLLLIIGAIGLAVTGPAAWRALAGRPRPDGELLPLPLVAGSGALLLAAGVWLGVTESAEWRSNATLAAMGAVAIIHAWRRYLNRAGGA